MTRTVRTSLMIALLLVAAACGDGSGTTAAPSSAVEAAPATASTEAAVATTQTNGATTAAAAPVEHAGVFALVGGSIIDGTGGEPIADGVVVIESGVITAVGPASGVTIPDGAMILDAGGGTILPGLVDTHTHHLNRLKVENGELEGFATDLSLITPLASGVTTYRDAGSRFGDSADLSELRAAIGALGVPVPTVVATGPFVTNVGNRALSSFGDQAVGVADAAAAEAAVHRLLDNGVDQVKFLLEHWEWTATPSDVLTAEQLDAISRSAHDRGAWVLAHVSDAEEARVAIDHGADELTHWPGSERLPDDLINDLAAGGIPVGTTFGISVPFEGDVRRLLDAGGTIVLSSDAPGVMSGTRMDQELERMVRAGMTPMEAIIGATRDAATAVGLGDRVGTLETGKAADIVVIAGDPIEDITTMANVTMVMKDGAVVVGPGGSP